MELNPKRIDIPCIIEYFRLASDDLVCVREGYSLQKQIPKHKEERGLQIK